MAEKVSDFNATNNYLLLFHLSSCRPQNYLYLVIGKTDSAKHHRKIKECDQQIRPDKKRISE